MLTILKKSSQVKQYVKYLLFAVSQYTQSTMNSVIIVIIYLFGKTSIFSNLK